jgi:uncharacterized OB-fold protein
MAVDKQNFGTVDVMGGKYKPKGIFHRPEKNTPIRREDGKLVGITNPRDITHMHSYGGEALYFESLGKGLLYGTRCDNQDCESKGSIFMPFRIACPDCLEKATPVDMAEVAKKTATVHSFIITERTGAFNALEIPIRFINVEFEGVCTILMSYMPVGQPEIGMRVVPIFKTTDPDFLVTDLAFVPEGTSEDKLPEGFSFG